MAIQNVSNGNPDGSTFGQNAEDKTSFHGSVPIVKQTVTGSRGANAALASLLTALESKGLIVDSTT